MPHLLTLRLAYPDDGLWCVADQEGEEIATIVDQGGHTSRGKPAWSWSISVFGLPQADQYRVREWSRVEAFAKIQEHWPTYRAQYSHSDYEFRRRQFHEQQRELGR